MIYAITEVLDRSVVKIGYTRSKDNAVHARSVAMRLGGIQTGTWRDLLCIAAMPGNRRDEQTLHHTFRRLHVRGEWFSNQGIVAKWLQEWRLEQPILSRNSKRQFFEPSIPSTMPRDDPRCGSDGHVGIQLCPRRFGDVAETMLPRLQQRAPVNDERPVGARGKPLTFNQRRIELERKKADLEVRLPVSVAK